MPQLIDTMFIEIMSRKKSLVEPFEKWSNVWGGLMAYALSQFTMKTITGEQKNLGDFEGKILLIVNVASKCGLTPQYEGLEKIYKSYKDQGFLVLGFPANEFLAQEPGTSSEIQEFCRSNYGIDFLMFEKIIVKGEGQHPLYKHLTENKKDAIINPDVTFMNLLKEHSLLTGSPHDIKWNFEKFLIGKNGEIIARFAPDIAPEDKVLTEAIEKVIKN